MATAEETGTGRRGKRRSATHTRLWGWLLVPPALWMFVFFVSSIVIVILLLYSALEGCFQYFDLNFPIF